MSDKLSLTLEEIKELGKKEKKSKVETKLPKEDKLPPPPKEEKQKKETKKPRLSAVVAEVSTTTPAKAIPTPVSVKPPLTTGNPVIFSNLDETTDLPSLVEIVEEIVGCKLKQSQQLAFNGKWHAARLIFSTKASAQKAIEEFNGRVLDKRKLIVRLQQTKKEL